MPTLAIPAGAITTGPILGDVTEIKYVDWNTVVWITRDGTVWQAYFGTPAPVAGGNLTYSADPPSVNAIAVVTLAAGAIDTGVIAGNFSAIRYVDWNTTAWPSLKTGSHFTFTVSTPAPAGGGHIGYVGAPVGTTLGDYLTEVRRLLHDAEGDFWTDADLISDINKAIRQRDMWSGGMRTYRPGVALTKGVDLYSLAVLFPDVVVLDVLNLWLIYGSTRVRLDSKSFTDVNDRGRPWTTYQNRPFIWSRYGSDQVFIAPKPASAYTVDWDLAVLSGTLVALGDTDPMAYPYTEPIAYYAAHLACVNARRWDLADQFMGQFMKAMRDIEGSRVGEMPLTGYGARR